MQHRKTVKDCINIEDLEEENFLLLMDVKLRYIYKLNV